MNKVIAVIVTYNRQQLLSECISALKNQTKKVDKILVINNGSTDDTAKWLGKQGDIEFISQENVGGAGGFYTGIKRAFESGYSWIWLMDDDGYPKNDALEKLLEDDKEELCLRNCAVLNKTDKTSFVWKTKNYTSINQVKENIIKNTGRPFNGTMLHRRIVERVGLPKSELFLWGDETEYYYRITRLNKIPSVTVASSIHYHPANLFSYKQEWDYKSGWKMYYYIRNRFHVQRSKFYKIKPIAYFMYAGFLLVFTFITLIFQKKDKIKKALFIFLPAKHALINNFNSLPANILHHLKTQSEYSLKESAGFNIKAFKNFTLRRHAIPLQQFEKA